jgi:hypothetical protein
MNKAKRQSFSPMREKTGPQIPLVASITFLSLSVYSHHFLDQDKKLTENNKSGV